MSDKVVYHSDGHLKRVDASKMTNGSYAFKVSNGILSIDPVENGVTTTSFKTPSGSIIAPVDPFIPIAINASGFGSLTLSKIESDPCAILYKGAAEGWVTQSIKGANVIAQLYGLTPESDGSALYYYSTTTGAWKALSVNSGYSFLRNNSGDLTTVEMNAENLYEYGFGYGKQDNVIIQYNKGYINEITVPTTQGNYNLGVDSSGNVSFSQGEVGQRQAVTYKLSAGNNVPTLNGTEITIQGSGSGNFNFNTTFTLKSNSKYYVDARFWFKVSDTSVFDDITTALQVTFKIGSSGTDGVIGSQYIYHPENGVLELHFTGVSPQLTTATPNMYITCDKSFSNGKIDLPFLDSTNVGQITFVEV